MSDLLTTDVQSAQTHVELANYPQFRYISVCGYFVYCLSMNITG
jgi:hypothetical protein